MNRIYLVVALLASTAGCKRSGGADAMALVPKESTVVFSLNFDRLHGSKTWAQVKDFANDPSNKKEYDEFVQKTGLDPMTQVSGLTGGFSGPTTGKSQFCIIVKGKFDEQKIIAYAKEKAKEDGKSGELKTEQYGGKAVYGDSEDAGLSFIDSSTFVVGGREWVHKVIDVSAGKAESVKKNEAIQALVGKAHTDQALWAVGQVPPGEGALPTGGEVKAIAASADLQEGFKGELNAQAASPEDAKKIADEIKKGLAEFKSDPQKAMMVSMSGMSSLIDSAKVETEGPWIKLTGSMTQQQLEELINRIKGMAQMMKGLGGMGGMSRPGGAGGIAPPGGMPDLPEPMPLAPPAKRKKK